MDMTQTQSFVVVTVSLETGEVVAAPFWEQLPGVLVETIAQATADNLEVLGLTACVTKVIEIKA